MSNLDTQNLKLISNNIRRMLDEAKLANVAIVMIIAPGEQTTILHISDKVKDIIRTFKLSRDEIMIGKADLSKSPYFFYGFHGSETVGACIRKELIDGEWECVEWA